MAPKDFETKIQVSNYLDFIQTEIKLISVIP